MSHKLHDWGVAPKKMAASKGCHFDVTASPFIASLLAVASEHSSLNQRQALTKHHHPTGQLRALEPVRITNQQRHARQLIENIQARPEGMACDANAERVLASFKH